jgi:hypothetical protein
VSETDPAQKATAALLEAYRAATRLFLPAAGPADVFTQRRPTSNEWNDARLRADELLDNVRECARVLDR